MLFAPVAFPCKLLVVPFANETIDALKFTNGKFVLTTKLLADQYFSSFKRPVDFQAFANGFRSSDSAMLVHGAGEIYYSAILRRHRSRCRSLLITGIKRRLQLLPK